MTRFSQNFVMQCHSVSASWPEMLIRNCATSSSNNSSSFLHTSSACCWLWQAMRVRPAQGYSIPWGSPSAPEHGNSGLASSGVVLFCRTFWRRRWQIPKPIPLLPTHTGEDVSLAWGWQKTTYLFAPVTMMMGHAGPLRVDIMRVLYVEVCHHAWGH